ncbi:MAG TPA: PqiC family protein [Candidatus Binatia bacterium]|nr:PqiC family protein [Candidatus Binatia bacterium]
MKNLAGVAACVMALSLIGCGSFSAKPDPSRFFTLSALPPLAPEAAKSPPESPGISIGVGPVTLPGYLDRQEIVTRVAQNQINLSENDRWAEPLEENFARVLSQNIATLLRADHISAYPWAIERKPLYQVEIEVLRFEADGAQQVLLVARWLVRNTTQKESARYREARLSKAAQGRSTESSVAALSDILADLSREIATAIESMVGRGK